MKPSLRVLPRLAAAVLVVLAPLHAAAQVPANGGLENWAVRSGLEQPTGWLTASDVAAAAGFPIPVNTTTKTTDARSGSFAARLESKSVLGFGVAPGFLILGSRLTGSGLDDFSAGVPYTGRPARLEFHYKLTGTPAALTADSAAAFVVLTRSVNGRRQVVAQGGTYLLAAAASYTASTVPLQYLSGQAPDTVQMFFSSAFSERAASLQATAGTALTIDDISLTGTVQAAQNPTLAAALSVYPNPSSSGEFQLASPSSPAVATAPYTITDATGQVVRTAAAAPLSQAGSRPVDLRGLPAGVYLLQLRTATGPLTRKLLVP